MPCRLVAALLTVVIHNTASVPDGTQGLAKGHLERIFAGSELRIAWANTVEVDTFPIQVILRRDLGGGPGPNAPSAFGTTVGEDHAHGGSCFVFYDRVLHFAHHHNRPADLILAYAIAHERGHVLLPAPAHTVAGLMKPQWNDDDLRHFANAERLFSVEQTARMSSTIEGGHVTK